MSKEADRDQVTDRLLKQAFAAESGALLATPDCPDAESMAAWMDGGLSTVAARAIEGHVADCVHCQTVLATLAASEPAAAAAAAPAPAPSSLWNSWRWFVPLAAGAAAVVTWIAVRPGSPVDQPEMTMARVEAPAAPAAATPETPPPPVQAEARDAAKPASSGPSGQAGASRGESERKVSETVGVVAQAPAIQAQSGERSFTVASESVQNLPTANRNFTALAQVPPGVAVIAEFAVAATRLDASEAGGAVSRETGVARGGGGRGGGRAASGPTAPAAPLPTAAAAPVPPPAPPASAEAASAPARSGDGNNIMIDGVSQIGAPDSMLRQMNVQSVPGTPVARWRVLVGGRVELMTAGATTWTLFPIEPQVEWRAGAAPDAESLWLVGPSGAVLRWEAGSAPVRVTAPAPVDLVLVSAASRQEARVTAVDGRVFTTVDGGKSWR